MILYLFSPDDVSSYLKARPRLNQKNGRKIEKACILTETPEKNRIEHKTTERWQKKKNNKTLFKKTV